jgi:uncharacterized protein YutE (UPF0331/DUF86 family)
VPPEELARSLAAIEEARRALVDLRSRPWDSVTGDRHLKNSLERSLEVAASSMIDICAHVMAREGLPPADTYRDVFQALVKADRLPDALGRKLEGWASLRNVLAHRYGAVDHSRLRAVLENDLSDLDEFLSWAAGLG